MNTTSPLPVLCDDRKGWNSHYKSVLVIGVNYCKILVQTGFCFALERDHFTILTEPTTSIYKEMPARMT